MRLLDSARAALGMAALTGNLAHEHACAAILA